MSLTQQTSEVSKTSEVSEILNIDDNSILSVFLSRLLWFIKKIRQQPRADNT